MEGTPSESAPWVSPAGQTSAAANPTATWTSRPGWVGVVPLGGEAPDAVAATPEPRDRTAGRRRVGAIVEMLAGVAVIIGSFLPWVRAQILGQGIRIGSGWRNVEGGIAHGPWFMVFGTVMIFAGMSVVFVRARRMALLAAVAGLAAIALAIAEVLDITSPGAGIRTALSSGIWVMLGGGVVALLGAILLRSPRSVVASGGPDGPVARWSGPPG